MGAARAFALVAARCSADFQSAPKWIVWAALRRGRRELASSVVRPNRGRRRFRLVLTQGGR
jgi:hypothetical protein